MTLAPKLMPYTGNNLVPITSKVPAQQPRVVHTKAKPKTNKATTSIAMQTPSDSSAATVKPKVTKRKPLDVLQTILSSADAVNGSSSENSSAAVQQQMTTPKSTSLTTPKVLTFQKPSEVDIAAYDLETVKAIRSNNLDLLRQLWQSGKSMDACNQFGESVLHMACRRGYRKVVEFLLVEVKVRTDRCDDFGRNPFHDALWTSTPNFDVVDLLIDHADPALLLTEDVRGNTPFAYARNDHRDQWNEFLEKRKGKLINRMRGSVVSNSDGGVDAAKKVEVVG